METLFTEWLEFLQLLTRHRVRFLLIGGHAIAVHAQPRYTEDLDVFVDATPANAKRLRAALVEFGFGAVAPPVELLATRDKVFMLGRKPFRIDVLTGIDGVTFERAWRERTSLKLGSLRIPVIGRTALVANKRAAGRPKDLIDVLMLGEKRPHSPAKRVTKKRAAPAKRRR
jgi:Nucleotidyl transferase AbiEii toxin, Type IV TA system